MVEEAAAKKKWVCFTVIAFPFCGDLVDCEMGTEWKWLGLIHTPLESLCGKTVSIVVKMAMIWLKHLFAFCVWEETEPREGAEDLFPICLHKPYLATELIHRGGAGRIVGLAGESTGSRF